jgi:hypothetical protein
MFVLRVFLSLSLSPFPPPTDSPVFAKNNVVSRLYYTRVECFSPDTPLLLTFPASDTSSVSLRLLVSLFVCLRLCLSFLNLISLYASVTFNLTLFFQSLSSIFVSLNKYNIYESLSLFARFFQFLSASVSISVSVPTFSTTCI